VMIVRCFGPGGNAELSAGTWMTIVSGVLPVPGVQLTMPPVPRAGG